MKKLILPVVFTLLCIPSLAEGYHPENAQKVEDIFDTLQSREPASVTEEFSITEDEFNDWLESRTIDKKYIRSVEAGFHDDNEADLYMEMDISKMENGGYYPGMLAAMFEGSQKLKVGGQIKVADSHFTFLVNSLSINDTHVTPALVAPLISMLLPDYDLTEPMELPFGITDIRTSEGLLTIVR